MKKIYLFILFLVPLFSSAQTYRSLKQDVEVYKGRDTLIQRENDMLIRFVSRGIEVETVSTGQIEKYDVNYEEKWTRGEVVYHTTEHVLSDGVDFVVKRSENGLMITQSVEARWGLYKKVIYYIEE